MNAAAKTSGYAATPQTSGAVNAGLVHPPSIFQAIQSLLYIIVVALFIITFTMQPFRIPSESMEPTLLVGDFLLVNKEVSPDRHFSVFAPTSEIERGDLVVFYYPVQPLLHLVKRVVGLPGDRVHLRSGHVFVNGRALPEPYAVFRPSPANSFRDNFPFMATASAGVDSRWWIQMRSAVSNGELVVPPDSYFVLGDNRNDSEDSRYWGFVPRSAIVGKPFLIYFSLNKLDEKASEGVASGAHKAALGPLADIARWDRALRVIH